MNKKSKINKGFLSILGAGESGVGAAILGKKVGYEVFVSDRGVIKTEFKKVLENIDVDLEEGQHTEQRILNSDLVVKSPGIPDTISLIQKIKATGIPVISEIEFAYRFSEGITVGITGSNGKTTTTMLVHHILKEGGLDVSMAGNIGDSYAKQVAENDTKYSVLEVSSFQLDGVKQYAPHIAVLTNITPDHLDRYENNFSRYVASKFRITMNQTEQDFFIYDGDDTVIKEYLEEHPVRSRKLPFL